MELKELLGEELANQVAAKLGDKKLILDDGKLVPQYRIKELTDRISDQEGQIKKNNDDLKILKDAASGNETLTKQISDLQRANREAKEKFEVDQLVSKKSFAVKEALLAEGVADEEARNLLAVKFDPAKVELDDAGKVKGFPDAIKPFKENPAFKGMFGQTVMAGTQHRQGENGNPISDLEQKLVAAQKAGKLSEVVAIRNQLYEQQKT